MGRLPDHEQSLDIQMVTVRRAVLYAYGWYVIGYNQLDYFNAILKKCHEIAIEAKCGDSAAQWYKECVSYHACTERPTLASSAF